MPISEAYRRCPDGIYMRPNGQKYEAASREIHEIWKDYTDIIEHISLDEGFLDVTRSMDFLGGASNIAHEIKRRVREKTGLTCSVGIGYSLMSAKLASEEKKPDGYFEIMTAECLKDLIIDRSVRIIYGVGPQTEAELLKIGIRTVRDIYDNVNAVLSRLGNHGKHIIDLANGIDDREVAVQTKSLSFGREHTFQQDISDREYLKDVLRLIARELSYEIRLKGQCAKTTTLKVTYKGFKKITRSKTSEATNKASVIYSTAADLLDGIDSKPIRLIGITLSGFSDSETGQLSMFDTSGDGKSEKKDSVLLELQKRYGFDTVKTGSEALAEKRLSSDGEAVP
jgi:DNA polymerase-4/DNA polymerase IV (DinB-like DNA polymerase)